MWNYNECVDQGCEDQPCVGWDNKPVESRKEIPDEWFKTVEMHQLAASDLGAEYRLTGAEVNKILRMYNFIKRHNGGWAYDDSNYYHGQFSYVELEIDGVPYLRYSKRMAHIFNLVIKDLMEKIETEGEQ